MLNNFRFAFSFAVTSLAFVYAGSTSAEPEGASGAQELTQQPVARSTAAETCQRIEKRLASVHAEDCDRTGLVPSGGVSVKGTPILVQEYPPVGDKLPQARILLFGGIHPDELATISIVFKWMRTLDEHHSGLFHWRIVPLVNPDGLFLKKATRTNANGVDLNRNFPTPDWRRLSKDYWIRRTGRNPRRFPGSSPLSEPESAWLAQEIERFKPDAIVALHAPFSLIDYDGPKSAPEKIGRLRRNLMGVYPGSVGNYAGVQRNIPVLTLELQYAGIMPSKHDIDWIWTDLVQWLRANITSSDTVTEAAVPDRR